ASMARGQDVSFCARYRASNIEMTARNVVASLLWLDENGKEIGEPEFVATTAAPDAKGWRRVAAVFEVPAKAKQAQMELRLRFSASGQVEWRDAQLIGAEPPAPRVVKIASVNHRPRGTKSALENLDQFAKLIEQAGAAKADIVCLPEGITVVGRGSDYFGAAETIPGPSTELLGKLAVKNH